MHDAIVAQIDFVKGHHEFWRCVCNLTVSAEFPFDSLFTGKQIGNLDEALFSVPDSDEIDFPFESLSGKYCITSCNQFIINDVFQEKGILIIDCICIDSTKAHIDGIMFFPVAVMLYLPTPWMR